MKNPAKMPSMMALFSRSGEAETRKMPGILGPASMVRSASPRPTKDLVSKNKADSASGHPSLQFGLGKVTYACICAWVHTHHLKVLLISRFQMGSSALCPDCGTKAAISLSTAASGPRCLGKSETACRAAGRHLQARSRIGTQSFITGRLNNPKEEKAEIKGLCSWVRRQTPEIPAPGRPGWAIKTGKTPTRKTKQVRKDARTKRRTQPSQVTSAFQSALGGFPQVRLAFQ